MNELSYGYESYEEYKDQLDKALGEAVENFVIIGYLLRTAKEDPTILEGSGYNSINDMAKAEYGLDGSQVSRFISINERYGDGPELLPQYRGFGQSKLSEMLSLPAAVAEELPQTITRAEIRELKEEIREEKKITDIEVAIERAQYPDIDIWEEFFKDWAKKHPTEFIELRDDDLYECFRNKVLTARVPGEGKMALTEDGESFTLTNMRDSSKHLMVISDFTSMVFELVQGDEPVPFPFNKEQWEKLTGETFPEEKKEEIAPAQEEKPLTTAPETKEKPDKIEKPEPKAEVVPKSAPTKNIESSEEDTEPDKAAEPIEEETETDQEEVETVEATVEDAPADEKPEDPEEIEIEEARKLKRIANDLRALGDQFDAGTGGNLYGNPIEELEGMIDEINSLPGLLIPIVEDAIRRIKLKEGESE